jgi:hypothetical protein
MLDTTGLDPPRERALIALVNEPNIRAAAKAAGISEATLYRYRQEPAFAQAYRQTRRQALEDATSRLSQLATEMVEVLREVARDARYSPYARVQAARAALDLAYRALDLYDQEERIQRLEALLGEKGGYYGR